MLVILQIILGKCYVLDFGITEIYFQVSQPAFKCQPRCVGKKTRTKAEPDG